MAPPKATIEEKEKLINLVKNQTDLYDQTAEGYKDTVFIARIWSSIASDMGRKDVDGKYSQDLWFRGFHIGNKKHQNIKFTVAS